MNSTSKTAAKRTAAALTTAAAALATAVIAVISTTAALTKTTLVSLRAGDNRLVKAAVLTVYAVVLAVTFTLLVLVLELPFAWASLGLLLALPAVAAIWYAPLLSLVRGLSLAALLVIVSGATGDLWAQLFSQGSVDASLHLLVLLLSLLLAIGHHLLQSITQAPAEDANSVSVLLEAGLRGPPILAMLCLTLLLGGALLAYLYASEVALFATLAPKLLDRGIIPPITLNLFLWGMALVMGKWLLTARELRLADKVSANLAGNKATAKEAGNKATAKMADQEASQSAFHAAYRASTKQGDGQEEFSATLWQQFEAFYTLPRYINWAIPILGFIGTVLGISLATEGLGDLLGNSDAEFSESLGQALEPLGIAFDTTLVALSLSIVYALCQTLLYRWEERHLLKLTEELKRDAR